MKKKALLSSILVIALCLCLIAGSTFALFTNSSEFNIAVTSGDVEIEASASVVALYSAKGDETGNLIDENGNKYSHENRTKDGTFTNGGTAEVTEGGTLTISKITPGDKVQVSINTTNHSNVAFKFRYKISVAKDSGLATGMILTDHSGSTYEAVQSFTSEWFDVVTPDEKIAPAKEFSLELPVYAGNEYQSESSDQEDGRLAGEKSVAYTVTVEAVQSNAVTEKGVKVEYLNPVGTDAAFAAAVTANKTNIVVSLTADVTYMVKEDINRVYEMGGANTNTITINGNGHTITFKGLSDDNNDIMTKNGAKLIINNANITMSGDKLHEPWNSHDIIFACDVELKNVTSDKALALKANAILDNVTITDNATDDTYAIWIQANGQTVTLNECTIDMSGATDGRGIAINDQYVENTAAKVTLKVYNTVIKTDEKAAIMVNSAAGADITLYNVDITAVQADTTNAVWVESAVDKVTVKGGDMIQK